MEKILQKLERYLLYAIIFLVPLAVLSIFPNIYEPIKLAILTFGLAAILLIKAIKILIKAKMEIGTGTFDFPVLLTALAYLLSAVFRTPNKMEAFFLPGTASAVIAATLVYFLINQLKKKEKVTFTISVLLSGATVALITLLAFLGVFAKIPQLPFYAKSNFFSPLGGSLPTAIYLASLIPLGVGLVLSEKILTRKLAFAASTATLALGLSVSIFNMLPEKPSTPRLPGLQTSWAVAIDTLKEKPILGIGPGNYPTAFSRFRPLSFNTSDLWPIKFSTASGFYLTLLTETGLLGAAGIILLFLTAFRKLRDALKEVSVSTNLISLALLIILLAIFPAPTSLILLLFIVAALNTTVKRTTINLSAQPTTLDVATSSSKTASRLPAILVTFPIIAATLVFAFYAVRALIAEAKFNNSLDAIYRGEALSTYNLMRAAIDQNPSVDRYHASYSQVNLALANSIAGKEEITDQDRANIAQLVQQAIREAKTTVALNPQRAGNWELLARTYRSIIPFAQGADAFAIQTMTQAVALDPINPSLRIALGGIHYARGDYDRAVRVFELATVAKPDLANTHYNLAFALREKGDIEAAINEMSIVLSLVDKETSDYELARQALEDLEAKRELKAAEGAELSAPKVGEKQVLEPPIELPEEAEPPEIPATPTPTTPSPTPTPTG